MVTTTNDLVPLPPSDGTVVTDPNMIDRSGNNYTVCIPPPSNYTVVAPNVVDDSPFGSSYNCLEFDQNYYSNTLNGLNVDPNAGIIGTEDFCIEYWHKAISNNYNDSYPLSMMTYLNTKYNGYISVLYHDTSLAYENQYFNYSNNGSHSNLQSPNITPYGDDWKHWAIVRRSGTMNIYCNGQQVGSTVFVDKLVDTTQPYSNFLRLGFICDNNSTYEILNKKFRFYNIRITKGNPVYTGVFTPPNQPLTPVAGTQLLIC